MNAGLQVTIVGLFCPSVWSDFLDWLIKSLLRDVANEHLLFVFHVSTSTYRVRPTTGKYESGFKYLTSLAFCSERLIDLFVSSKHMRQFRVDQ